MLEWGHKQAKEPQTPEVYKDSTFVLLSSSAEMYFLLKILVKKKNVYKDRLCSVVCDPGSSEATAEGLKVHA